MAMNMYDTKCSSLSNIKTLYILIQTNFFAPTKTEIELQSQLIKQKHPLPRLECSIFYHNTNVCHNFCQLRDEIINFLTVVSEL